MRVFGHIQMDLQKLQSLKIPILMDEVFHNWILGSSLMMLALRGFVMSGCMLLVPQETQTRFILRRRWRIPISQKGSFSSEEYWTDAGAG
jgi:hypothetical protein